MKAPISDVGEMLTHALTFYRKPNPKWSHPTPKVRFTFIERGPIDQWEVLTESFYPDGTLHESGRCAFKKFEQDLLGLNKPLPDSPYREVPRGS